MVQVVRVSPCRLSRRAHLECKRGPVCDAPVPLSRRRACPVPFEPSLGHVICDVAVPERDLCLSLLRWSQISLLMLCQTIWKLCLATLGGNLFQFTTLKRRHVLSVVTSRSLLGNICTLFHSLWSLRETMFTTFKYLSRGSIRETPDQPRTRTFKSPSRRHVR